MTREEAIKAVKEVTEMSLPWNDRHYESLQMAIKALEEPKRKKGKWINGVCDQCGSHAPYWAMATTYYKSSFCPNCGADMRGEQDDESRSNSNAQTDTRTRGMGATDKSSGI